MQPRWKTPRARFIAGTVACAAPFSLVQGRARAAQFELRAGSDVPLDHPVSAHAAQMFGAIEQESGGRLRIGYFPNSQLGNAGAMLSQLRLGALDMQIVFAANIGEIAPAFNVASLCFAFRDEDEALRTVGGGPLSEYMIKEATTKNIVPLRSVWGSSMYEITSASRPIRTLDDLKGFKVRVAPSKIVVDLFKELGASPTAVAPAEIYTALQTKLVDGTASGLSALEVFKVYEVQKFVNLTNHEWAGLWTVVAADTWKKLPADLQGIIDRNNTKFCNAEHGAMKAYDDSIRTKLVQQGMTFSPVDRVPFIAASRNYFKEWSDTLGPTVWGLLQNALGRRLV